MPADATPLPRRPVVTVTGRAQLRLLFAHAAFNASRGVSIRVEPRLNAMSLGDLARKRLVSKAHVRLPGGQRTTRYWLTAEGRRAAQEAQERARPKPAPQLTANQLIALRALRGLEELHLGGVPEAAWRTAVASAQPGCVFHPEALCRRELVALLRRADAAAPLWGLTNGGRVELERQDLADAA